MRLRSMSARSHAGSLAHQIYGTDLISERHRHRFEFNCRNEPTLREHGMRVSGRSPDGKFVEIAELPGHLWFVAVQFHPEFKSRPLRRIRCLRVSSARHISRSPRGRENAGRGVLGMMTVTAAPAGAVTVGPGHPLAFIVGPHVIESESHAIATAVALRDIAERSGASASSSKRPTTRPIGHR